MKKVPKLLALKETFNKLISIQTKVVSLPDDQMFIMSHGKLCVLGILYAPLSYDHISNEVFNFNLDVSSYHTSSKYQKKVFQLFHAKEEDIFSDDVITKQEWLEKCEEVLLYLNRKIQNKESKIDSLIYIKDVDTGKYLAYDTDQNSFLVDDKLHLSTLSFSSIPFALDFIKTQKIYPIYPNISLEVFQVVEEIPVATYI